MARYGTHAVPCNDPELSMCHIADSENNRVRKVDPSGIITTIAGTGNGGFSGDGGPAASASLYSPAAIAFDAKGNLYIADSGNGEIRMVSASGTAPTNATSFQIVDRGGAPSFGLQRVLQKLQRR